MPPHRRRRRGSHAIASVTQAHEQRLEHVRPQDVRPKLTKSAEKPRRSGRGWIGVGRAGLNAQAPNKTHAVPEPSMGEGTAWVEAPAFMPGRTSTFGYASHPWQPRVESG